MTSTLRTMTRQLALAAALLAALAACGNERGSISSPTTERTVGAGDIPLAGAVTGGIPLVETFDPTSTTVSPEPSTSTTEGEPVPQPCSGIRFTAESFASNSWELTPQALEQIPDVVRKIRDSGAAQVEIVGHTDSRPTGIGNYELSQRRAQAVADALTAEGLDRTMITSVRGLGPDQPLDERETEEAFARNRRVEVTALCDRGAG